MNRDSTYEMFPRLKEKEKYLIDIIKDYDIYSVIKAAFTINSWRNNRGLKKAVSQLMQLFFTVMIMEKIKLIHI